MTHNASALDNHLILRKNPIKIKNYDFLCVAENQKVYLFVQLEKNLKFATNLIQ